jgi:hypothetical protein
MYKLADDCLFAVRPQVDWDVEGCRAVDGVGVHPVALCSGRVTPTRMEGTSVRLVLGWTVLLTPAASFSYFRPVNDGLILQ